MKKLNKYLIISILTYAVFSMAGCAQINEFFEEQPVLSMITVKHTVARKINTASDPKAKAIRYIDAVAKVRAVVDEGTVTLSTLDGVIKNALGYDKLELIDRLLIDDLLMIAKQSLAKELEVANVPIPEEYKVNLNLLLDAIEMGAKIHL